MMLASASLLSWKGGVVDEAERISSSGGEPPFGRRQPATRDKEPGAGTAEQRAVNDTAIDRGRSP